MKTLKLIILLLVSSKSFSQIKVIERKSDNVSLIGKISHTSAFQKAGLSRKMPVLDPFKVVGDRDINTYKNERREANNLFKTVGLRKMTFIDEEFSASLLYFSDRKKYLLTIKNSEYNYQNESIWLSEQTKKELFDLITSEIEKRPKYKNIEVILDSGVVLVVAINRKKISFNLWDGYSWVNGYWYRLFKFENLFGN